MKSNKDEVQEDSTSKDELGSGEQSPIDNGDDQRDTTKSSSVENDSAESGADAERSIRLWNLIENSSEMFN